MNARDELPFGALPEAAAAVMRAIDRGHAMTPPRWRRISMNMWGYPCPECGAVVYIFHSARGRGGERNRWYAGGSATFEKCAPQRS